MNMPRDRFPSSKAVPDAQEAVEGIRKVKIAELSTSGVSLLGARVEVEGRILAVRAMKNLWFADLGMQGNVIQLSCAHDISSHVGPGDVVAVQGGLFRTHTGQLTINASHIESIAPWTSSVPYSQRGAIKRGPLFALTRDAYDTLRWPQLCISSMQDFLRSRDFLEVHTPTVLRHYNGGRSFPVACSYLREPIGFFRTTMEERMQAFVACGFDRIFQIGNVFRSGSERILFEGYSAETDWKTGSTLFIDLLSHVATELVSKGIGEKSENVRKVTEKQWITKDFFSAAKEILGLDRRLLEEGGAVLISRANTLGIVKSSDTTPETLADSIANVIAEKQGAPTIIENYPYWSSPLYKSFTDDGVEKLLRARLYLPGDKSGAEMGIQENDVTKFRNRVSAQRASWGLPQDDDRVLESDLAEVISGGVRPMFGFATNIERILHLWRHDCTFDPFNEV